MTNYWMAVASSEHVKRGIEGGFCQVCHGKSAPLKLMRPDDWIAYYSPTEEFGGSKPCRKITAIGRINANEPYSFQMSETFIPWRRDVTFYAANEVAFEPLIEELSFIQDKRRWGFPFRRGCFKIPASDFKFIAAQMGIILA
ncbi:conserved hypothetical protein [Candidatus Protochlamydia naegleriophila]|uniref:UPF0310 protein PNK_0501 n=1 Tax=Candidatus Protochlamydia naegleriophila TaxID=389348 RepID=A0A0U5EQ58_9BACT|nr:EVE domain-containing protein [Candidatus Protochlamydia naegleriophila]CUI16129.1 conserved hypothetical protein [Candidatus Protochlamydia naegleriophila]